MWPLKMNLIDIKTMKIFLETLKHRNEPLYVFGLICLLASIGCIVMIISSDTKVMGVNAWYKPLKFCLSTVLFSWAMAWYTFYLGASKDIVFFNWTVIICLGFEIIYIAFQAGRGQLSHYNLSTPFYAGMFSLMALAATLVTVFTAYIGIKFFIQDFQTLPTYYLWSIRIGILLFVVFSLQGFVMGSNMGHTVGASDSGRGWPLVNWSKKNGDLRIAHFIGMHALQVLPILSCQLLKSVRLTLAVGIIYGLLAAFTLIQALQGKPLIKF